MLLNDEILLNKRCIKEMFKNVEKISFELYFLNFFNTIIKMFKADEEKFDRNQIKKLVDAFKASNDESAT